MKTLVQEVESLLREKLNPLVLKVEDDSAKHRGHAGARQGAGHLIVEVESELFQGKTLQEQHRLVYSILQDFMGPKIHALKLNTKVPKK